MPRPKSKKRMYFDEVVQDAIIQYKLSYDTQARRSRFYASNDKHDTIE